MGAILFAILYLYAQSGLLAQTTESASPSELQDQPTTAEIQEVPFPQEAEEEQHPIALDHLPKAKMGYPDWVAALTEGVINPRESLEDDFKPMPPLDFDVVFQIEGDFPDAVYPHFPHTIWLDCRNCHPAIFKMQAGTNPVTMAKIFQGEFCGRCHGVVAFPLADCFRCHSKPK